MERLMVVTTFQKAIDTLKTTECSQKEKLALFAQITDCIQSSALRANTNYLSFVSNAVSILLMFCEELDSVVRMSAEENLNKIIRFSTPTNIVRIQYDLFQEIKRNGNDRSLRIALNLFSHYAHLIKQRKIKPYALNVLPCILSISHRKEQQLIETLSQFVGCFCKYFQISLTENEVSNLIEIFVKDAVNTDCSVKRRCSASNVISLIDHSKRPDVMAKHALNICLDNLVKDPSSCILIGTFGLLRVLLPKVLSMNPLEPMIIHKVIEIYEICLHLLNEDNHTIINASLECLCVILNHSKSKLDSFLFGDTLNHLEILCKKRTLKNQMFRRKGSTPSTEALTPNIQSSTPDRKSKFIDKTKHLENDDINLSSILDPNRLNDDKALLTCSDIENESFKINESESERNFDSPMQSPARVMISKSDSSQKSTDSIGSFFNNILTHPNTESVSKFFRVGTSNQQTESTSKPSEEETAEQKEADNISMLSMSSLISLNSQNSSALGTYDFLNKTDDSTPEIEVLNGQEIASLESQTNLIRTEHDELDRTQDFDPNFTLKQNTMIDNELFIGTINDQPLIHYTIRLIASRFLLTGVTDKLIDDCTIRVSIKNLSLTVIGYCVNIWPGIVLLSLQKGSKADALKFCLKEAINASDSEDSECAVTEKFESKIVNDDAGDQLCIKDDHFGENSRIPSSYFDFSLPLSKSADHVLLSQLTSADDADKTQRLNNELTDLLSKSDIIDSKSSFKYSNIQLKPEWTYHKTESSSFDSESQAIEDIFLFWNHSDPILRANIQSIAGNILFSILNEFTSIESFIRMNGSYRKFRFINLNILIHILLKGLTDDIHTVVKQSLTSLEKILSCALDQQANMFSKMADHVQSEMLHKKTLSIDFNDIGNSVELVEKMLNEILLVNENKYWVVRNKYCQFVTTINFKSLSSIVGCDKGQLYRIQFMEQIYMMLGDVDARIRTEAIKAICDLNVSHSLRNEHSSMDRSLVSEFLLENISIEIPYLLNHQTIKKRIENNGQMKRNLGKCLFDLTNMLLDMESKECLLGVTKCLLDLMEIFDPINFNEIWSEFNILEVSLSLLNSNYITGTDLICQNDTMTLCINLLAANVLSRGPEQKLNIRKLLSHVMKLLNIYHYILTNKRPIFIPKGQKADIFVNAKEIQMINSHGYFGNDYFYLKIYKTLRIIYESYKITINDDIDAKMFTLLKTGLRTVAILLEIMPFCDQNDSNAFFDEILTYIKTFIIYVPKTCVICIEQLLKFMFSMNFASRNMDNVTLDAKHSNQLNASEIFESLKVLKSPPILTAKSPSEPTSSSTGSKLIGFLASTPEKTKSTEDKNIKVFEPLVIQCLKLFTKSDSNVQSSILSLLCRVLYLKVNYYLLDANNIFMEFILKLLESIETGLIRDSHILTPRIIEFLFHLAKQRERPQMTIPKIINITDTLLANSITNNGSIEALCQLAYEIYFASNTSSEIEEDRSILVTSEKESNTQKEVVFSMLLKFIGESMVKKTICIILMKENEKNNQNNIKSELIECLLHVSDERKPFVQNYGDFLKLGEMIRLIYPELDQSQKMKITQRLLNQNSSITFDDLAMKTIILECILSNENEINFTSIFSNAPADNMRTSLINFLSTIDNNLFSDADHFIQYLSLLQKYCNLVISINSKWPTIGNDFRQNVTANTKLIEEIFGLMKCLSKSMRSTSIIHKEQFDAKKYELAIILTKLTAEMNPMLVDVLKDKECDWTACDRFMRKGLLEVITSMPLKKSQVDHVLQNHFEELLDSDFIKRAALEQDCMEFILSRLRELINEDDAQEKAVSSFLDILETADDEVVVASINYLLEIIPKVSDSHLLRRSFRHLAEMLNKSNTMEAHETIIPNLKQFKSQFQTHQLFIFVSEPIDRFLCVQEEEEQMPSENIKCITVNDEWFQKKAIDALNSKIDKCHIYQILAEIKSEAKLRAIFDSTGNDFDENLIRTLIKCSFETMTTQFKQDCFQHNAHMNYLKVSNVLKQSMNMLCSKLEDIYFKLYENNENPNTYESHKTSSITPDIRIDLKKVMPCVQIFLKEIMSLEMECLIYVEATAIRKFIDEHFFRMISFERLTQFAFVCLNFLEHFDETPESSLMFTASDCLLQILRTQASFNETDNQFDNSFYISLLNVCYLMADRFLASKLFIHKNQLNTIVNQLKVSNKLETSEEYYAMAIFLAKFIECAFLDISTADPNASVAASSDLTIVKNTMIPLMIETMRSEMFYFFAVTPYEIVQSFDWHSDIHASNRINHLPSIPIDYLNEAEIVEKFVRRVNIFGFPSRPYFEEIFMSLLLLMNQENDSNVVDAQEEYQIKSMCLTAIIEMLLSCKMYPRAGDRSASLFHHIPRLSRPKADTISAKKLHKIQIMKSGYDQPNIFYMPNLERFTEENCIDNIIGTKAFHSQQFDLNIIWHLIEGEPSKAFNIELRNMSYFLIKSTIDINSSIQLTFDVITQLIEVNCIQTLPQIAKFCEICENRDQFHWMKDTMNKLIETIPIENVDAHQHIVYCLCKSYAVLVPSVHDLNHLCTLLSGYLKNSHLLIRVAALKGILLLFESCIKTNTTIGSLNEEILQLRTFIINYISKNGIVEESTLAYSNEHTKLVWTLNFYVIETTSKFVTECNLVANTIISANNFLKRTTNFQQYACIIYGLERIIISRTITEFLHEKIEKLALELVKSVNEMFSLLALRLLMTCMYIGSNEQLENTERCNGIVQDEPEIIVKSTEIIEVLFHRIKVATNEAAHTYGNVLCQLTRDLVPPKELLTKVIKELLTTSQPHCEVIAKILFQVFRSAIDSTYLRLLQDWLLCSLPNFLSFHVQKVMWYLTVIFVSVSINFDLIKIFPQILAEFSSVCDYVDRDKIMKTIANETNANLKFIEYDQRRQHTLFVLACRDFYHRLSEEQQNAFRSIFTSMDETEIKEMLNAL